MEKSLYSLHVGYRTGKANYPSNDTPEQFRNQSEKGREALERRILAQSIDWEYAVMYRQADNKPVSYYHKNTGARRLTVAEYNSEVAKSPENKNAKYKYYCVPNIEAQTRGAKPYSKFGDTVEEAHEYLTADLCKILVYDLAKKTNNLVTELHPKPAPPSIFERYKNR
jgi:hypothetical protein